MSKEERRSPVRIIRPKQNRHAYEDQKDLAERARTVKDIPDGPPPKGLGAGRAAASMAEHVMCRPEKAIISHRQCQHLQTKGGGQCDSCLGLGLRPRAEVVPPDILSALADLEGLVAGVRPEVPGDFERMAEALEACRDCVRDYLDSLPEEGRPKVEFLLSPQVDGLAHETWKLAQKALASGVITERLCCDIGCLSNSVLFVIAYGRMAIAGKDFRLEDYL